MPKVQEHSVWQSGVSRVALPLFFVDLSRQTSRDEVEFERRTMNDKEIGRVWAEYYPQSGDNREMPCNMWDNLAPDTSRAQVRFCQ